jgi:hypothetical protein
MELKEDGIYIDGVFIPFTEDQIKAIKSVKEKDEQKERLERLGHCEKKPPYWTITQAGNIEEITYDSINNNSFRNTFKEKEHAQQELKRQEILADLIRNSDPEESYQIIYNTEKEIFVPHYTLIFPSIGQPPMTEEKAKEMICKWGDDLKLLLYL